MEFPGLLTLIDLCLVGFGLETCEVGEDAREAYLLECACAIRPLELAEEVLYKGLIFVDAGVGVYFTGEDGAVHADLGLSFVEAL